MIAIIFEVFPKADQKQNYLELGAIMRAEVEKIEGFVSIERFQSLTNPDKLLSLSVFRYEAAVDEWRQVNAHRHSQSKGRHVYFDDYRLRVASVIRDYGMFEREEAPADSRAVNEITNTD